jgi:hypothetical protein
MRSALLDSFGGGMIIRVHTIAPFKPEVDDGEPTLQHFEELFQGNDADEVASVV